MTVHHARVIALAAVLIGISTLVPATYLWAQQDFDELSLEDVRVLAEQDDPAAQATLGDRYLEGRGVSQDNAEALRWFRRAAEQGHAHGLFRLGWMYDGGRSVPHNDSEARRFYVMAATLGHGDAHFNLGLIYANGINVEQDWDESVRGSVPRPTRVTPDRNMLSPCVTRTGGGCQPMPPRLFGGIAARPREAFSARRSPSVATMPRASLERRIASPRICG